MFTHKHMKTLDIKYKDKYNMDDQERSPSPYNWLFD